MGDLYGNGRVLDIDNGFKLIAQALLNVLTQGVQIGGEHNGCREQTAIVLTLALAVQLLPPLAEHLGRRLVGYENLRHLSLAVHDIAKRCVAQTVVLQRIRLTVLLPCIGCTLHHRVDIDTGTGDRKQTDRGKNGIAAAYVIRHDEGLVTHIVGEALKRSACLIGCGKDTLTGAILTVLFLQQFAEDTEGDRRLGSGAGLGNHVYADILALTDGKQFLQSRRADAVAGKVYGRRILGKRVIKRRGYKLNSRACTQIGSADTDYHEDIAHLLDALRRCLDACKFFFIIIYGQIDPTEKIRTRSAAIAYGSKSIRGLGRKRLQLVCADKTTQKFFI